MIVLFNQENNFISVKQLVGVISLSGLPLMNQVPQRKGPIIPLQECHPMQ